MASRTRTLSEPPPIIVVVDASILIELKTAVPLDEQWQLFRAMEDHVKSGCLAFPKQVAREMRDGKYPDGPGVWTADAKSHIVHADPALETLAEVLDVAPGMVDANAGLDMEKADPYVAAMAVELTTRYPGSRVVVATNDVIDRPPFTSLAAGCGELSIECWRTEDFVRWCLTGKTPEEASEET